MRALTFQRAHAACRPVQPRIASRRAPLVLAYRGAEEPKPTPQKVEAVVTLDYNGQQEKMRLVNNKVQLSAIKDAFNLQTIKINGNIEPVDQLGFTMTEFAPGDVIAVTGTPTAELERLHAEIAGLRAELRELHALREDMRSVASLSRSVTSMTESYDDIKRLVAAPGATSDDIAVIKRLVAEMVLGSKDGPDFTKTSVDGYTFDTWWEGRMLAKDIVDHHSEANRHRRAHRHRVQHMDHDEVMSSFHAT